MSSTTYHVSFSQFQRLDARSARERCLRRGLEMGPLIQQLNTEDAWVELCIEVQSAQDGAYCGTGEELLCRLLSRAQSLAGCDRETALESHFKGKLHSPDFHIDLSKTPIHIVELDYTAGDARSPARDSMRATVLFAEKYAPGIERIESFDSSSYAGSRYINDHRHGQRLGRRRGEIRVIEAQYRHKFMKTLQQWKKGKWSQLSKGSIPHQSYYFRDSPHGLYIAALVNNKEKCLSLYKDRTVSEITLKKKKAPWINGIAVDGEDLWVGTDLGLYHLRGTEVIKQYTNKDGLGGKKVAGLHITADGTLVVGGAGNFTLMKEGEVLEVVDKGLVDKTACDIESLSNGEIWLRGYKGTTRRAPDGTLTKHFKDHLVVGHCPLGDRMIVSESYNWEMRHWCFTAGVKDPVELPSLAQYAGFIGATQAGGYDWLFTTAGELLALKTGEPIRQFAMSNFDISEFGQLSYADDVFWLSGRGFSYGVQLSDCLAVLRKKPDNVDLLDSAPPLFQFS